MIEVKINHLYITDEEIGMRLLKGSLNDIFKPAPVKTRKYNENALVDGSAPVYLPDGVKLQKRSFTLSFYVPDSLDNIYSTIRALQQVFISGYNKKSHYEGSAKLTIIKDDIEYVFYVVLDSISSYQAIGNNAIIKIKLTEPNPNNRQITRL